MANPCTCLNICTCLGGCCKEFCGEPSCEHELHPCNCGAVCDFCMYEENEELARIERNKEKKENSTSDQFNKRKAEAEEDEYDADFDSDDEEPVGPPPAKIKRTIYDL